MTYRIVVGLDASEHSKAALLWALKQATWMPDGEVVALFSWQMPFYGMPGGFERDELEQGAKSLLLQTVAETAPESPVPLRAIVAEGDPIESLVEASKQADLLVLGTRGRSRFGLMIGSVSQACSAHAACPVVLVKTPERPPPEPNPSALIPDS
ncbi:MAG TPA: universal stress protein [Streptosporangiaceae bacterium]